MTDQELETRLRRSAGPRVGDAPALDELAQRVQRKLARRRAARQGFAITGASAALLAAMAAWSAWRLPVSTLDGRRPAHAAPAALAEIEALRARIAWEERRLEELDRAARIRDYERQLAAAQPASDPLRSARVALERAAWLSLGGVERRSEDVDARKAGYEQVAHAFAGTYWGRVAEQRRQQLTQGAGS